MNMNPLTEREQQVYQQIVNNPYISQQSLSESLQLSRSTVANIISGLVRKNILLGRAYVLNESKKITCIGGANVDRKLYIKDKVKFQTSNPVKSSYSAGGVARNIGENLGKLGFMPTLITAAGTDTDWDIIESASTHTMNLSPALQLPHASTGAYTAVLDKEGELVVALADMDVFEAITPELILRNEQHLSQSRCIVADLNCPKSTLDFLTGKSESLQIPLVLVTVSSPKMIRLPADLTGVTWMMTNVEETESYFNCPIDTHEQLEAAIQKWLDTGVEYVTITNGSKEVIVGSQTENPVVQQVPRIHDIADVTGAGDAFCAGALYAWLEGMSLQDVVKFGIANASKSLQSNFTVRQDLTPTRLQKDVEELT